MNNSDNRKDKEHEIDQANSFAIKQKQDCSVLLKPSFFFFFFSFFFFFLFFFLDAVYYGGLPMH